MAVTVHIEFPAKPSGADRIDTEEGAVAFFSPLAVYLGHGTGGSDGGCSAYLGIPDGEDVKAWAARMCDTLRVAGAPAGTFLAIFPEDDREFLEQRVVAGGCLRPARQGRPAHDAGA